MSTPETKATFSSQQPRVDDLPGSTSWFMGFHLSWLASFLSVPLQQPGFKVPGAWVHPSVWPWVSHFALSRALLWDCRDGGGERTGIVCGGLSRDWHSAGGLSSAPCPLVWPALPIPGIFCRSRTSSSSSSARRKHVLIPDRLLMIPNPATDSGNS